VIGRLVVLALVVGVVIVLARRYAVARRTDVSAPAAEFPPLPAELVDAERPTWVVFTTPLCASCGAVEDELRRSHPDETVIMVDATVEPQLAERYRVRRAPTVVHADERGRVVARLVGAESVLSP
jgi:hypothetical protein